MSAGGQYIGYLAFADAGVAGFAAFCAGPAAMVWATPVVEQRHISVSTRLKRFNVIMVCPLLLFSFMPLSGLNGY